MASTFIFVDRRGTSRGKSISNRKKLLDRIRDSIRNSNPDDIDSNGVKGSSGNSTASKTHTNPVAIARDALHEPTFNYDSRTGEREIVLVGNDVWERGDEFPVSTSDESPGNRAGQGEGEDDFIVNISRSEFYDVFFEDCELPDMQETSERVIPESIMKPAGFQKDGNSAQLSIIRSFRNGLGRRWALATAAEEEIRALTDELKKLEATPGNSHTKRILWIKNRLEELPLEISELPLFEKVDLRYRKTEQVEVKQADAVLVMVMDVSGSMDEEKKTIARKFFALQYAFIERMYPNTDLVFIAHTDDAEEMSEEDFFTTRMSGGTTVSSGLKLANDIINQRYDPTQTNIYLSYAGDGDNWESDNKEVITQFEDKGLLSKLRHAVYVQVGQSFAAGFGSGPNLWQVMKSVSETNRKFKIAKIQKEEEIFKTFKSIYSKKDKA